MKFSILALLCSTALSAFSQATLDHEHIGPRSEVSQKYRAFVELRKRASTKELYQMLNEPDAVMKSYAGWALADRKYPKLFEIFKIFYSSQQQVQVRRECIEYDAFIYAEFYERVLSKRQTWSTGPDSLIFCTELWKMDSLMLYDNNIGPLTHYVAAHNKTRPSTYLKIRELAIASHNADLIAELGAYRNRKDIPVIASLDSLAIPAITNFPDSVFFPILEKNRKIGDKNGLFRAVAAYKNGKAQLMLSSLYNASSEAEREQLAAALNEFYTPIYKDLIFQNWRENRIIDRFIVDKLIEESPGQSATNFAQGLLLDKYNRIATSSEKERSEVITKMLEHIGKYNPEFLPDIMAINIPRETGESLLPYLNIVKQYKLTGTTSMLLKRLNTTKTTTDLYNVSTTLYSFNNIGVNRQVGSVLKSRKKEWQDAYNAAELSGLMKKMKAG